MAFRHGKTAMSVNAVNLSAYCDSAGLDIGIDMADTTTFGNAWKTALAGLAGGTLALTGDYDPTLVTGPMAVLVGIINAGVATAIVYRPGGTLTGQQQVSFSALINAYGESSPVADKVTFSCTLQMTGAPTFTTQ